jgi:hypothetical protein
MAALALMQTGTTWADGPPIPAPAAHALHAPQHRQHRHVRVQHHPMIHPVRTSRTPVVSHAPADPPAVPAKPLAPRDVPIVVDPAAAFPGASVLLRITSGCTAATTVTSAAFTAPAVLTAGGSTAGGSTGLTGSAQVNSTASAGIQTVTAQCAGGVRADGVLRVLSPAQLGAVHAGGGWGADANRVESAHRAGVGRPLDMLLAGGLALAGFLLTVLARQRSRANRGGTPGERRNDLGRADV